MPRAIGVEDRAWRYGADGLTAGAWRNGRMRAAPAGSERGFGPQPHRYQTGKTTYGPAGDCPPGSLFNDTRASVGHAFGAAQRRHEPCCATRGPRADAHSTSIAHQVCRCRAAVYSVMQACGPLSPLIVSIRRCAAAARRPEAPRSEHGSLRRRAFHPPSNGACRSRWRLISEAG